MLGLLLLQNLLFWLWELLLSLMSCSVCGLGRFQLPRPPSTEPWCSKLSKLSSHMRAGVGYGRSWGCVSWDYCIAGPILDREMWGTYSVDFCSSTSCPTWSGKGLWNRVWSKDPSSISSPTNPRLVHKFCLSCLPPGLQDRFQIWVTWSYTGNYLTVLSLQDVS